MKKVLISVFLMLIFWQGIDFISHAASEEGRVLFISSYSYAWDQVQIQIEGIRDGLGDDVVLDYEFMDTKRVDTEEALQLFHDGLAYRLSMVEPYDAVILGDDAALKFALEYQDELFAGIPIFFEGVNDEELAAKAAEDPLITGVLEKLSVEKNIELGLQINPDAKRVVAILDDSITGEAERKRFYKYAEQYPNLEFGEMNSSELRTFSLRYELGNVSSDTILIYVVMTEDADGRKYTNQQSIQLISECAKVPVLRMVDGGIGEGIFGGNVVSMYKSGEIAAQMAMKVMNGTPAEEIELVTDSPKVYRVDAAVMKRFGISEDRLPEDTEYINREESFFERNREVLIPGGILIGVLMVVLIWILIDNQRRRALMKELESARKILESAAQHDFLTGIPNRNKFMSDINQLVEEKRPCTVLMIDIDDFKNINDTMGHTAGDDALIQVAARLKEMESQILTPYRYAGDEFILILKSNQGKIVEKTAYQCRQVFAKPFVLDGNKAKICGSIGVASYPQDTDNVEQLIIYADDAMYRVKKNGKNDFAYYHAKEE
ncbi:MAG: diguanylate cyclase [Lachnospiraceae bacterium]|nr:diguanylate cyclase [Lachnospiraceae bacterium]